MAGRWKRSSVPWLLLISQSHGIGAQKRGFRRGKRSRFLQEETHNIFFDNSKVKRKGWKGGYKSSSKKSSSLSSKSYGKMTRSNVSIGDKGKGKGKGKGWDYDKDTVVETLATTTFAPTLTPTASIFLDIPARNSRLCKSEEGMFGSERGNSQLIIFVYRVELDPGTSRSQFFDITLPQIEITLVDMLVPRIFVSICGLFRRLNKVSSNYAGISALPSDYVVSEGDCGASVAQPCYVVNGFMTVYTLGSGENASAEISSLLQQVFETGNIANQVPGVDGVLLRSNAAPTQSPTTHMVLDLDMAKPATLLTSLPSTEPTITPAPANLENNVESQSPTSSPTVVQTSEPTELSVEERLSSDEPFREGIDWWRWLLLAIIIIAMLLAIYVVWTKCQGNSQPEQLPQDDDGFRADSQGFY